MNYIKKKIAAWEVSIGQIGLTGKDNILGRELFKDYFGKSFTLKTFLGDFPEINFNEKSSKSFLRLACSSFFKKIIMEIYFIFSLLIQTVLKLQSWNQALIIVNINSIINYQSLNCFILSRL